MKKKLLSVLLAGCMVLSLAACANDGGSATPDARFQRFGKTRRRESFLCRHLHAVDVVQNIIQEQLQHSELPADEEPEPFEQSARSDYSELFERL